VKVPGRKEKSKVVRTAAASLAVMISLAAGWPGAFAEGAEPPEVAGLKATLERLGSSYYAGDPVQIRISVFNTGEQPYDNSGGLDLLGNIIVSEETALGSFTRKPSPVAAPRFQPAVIPPGGFFGFIADLRDVVGGLEKPGRYVARLSLGDLQTDPLKLRVIPHYDPKVPYRATIGTDYGKLSFDLLGGQAPKHVRNFYDLAHQGFYEGAFIHAVVKGVHLLGGDTAGDGSSFPGYGVHREVDPTLVHRRGTLSMLPWRNMDHGSQFLISLSENRNLDGTFTIFGKMAQGEETLAALENLPTTGQREAPFYRPLKELRIRFVRVEPATDGSKATAEEAEPTRPESPE
jgi:cyclophilin family peptidyl-prolyl cis-trans isomerase